MLGLSWFGATFCTLRKLLRSPVLADRQGQFRRLFTDLSRSQRNPLSRGIRRCRLRRTRYIGLARTHLAHVLTAVAINFLRLGEWFTDVPRAQTRRSPYARPMADTLAA